MRPILLATDAADRVAAVLEPQFPDLTFVQATNAQAILAALSEHQPEVAFSIKHPGFPPPAHRPIVDHPAMRWVHVGGSGYEHFVPWDQDRLMLTNSVGVLARFLAETTIGAMLSLNLGFPRYFRQQAARQWEPQLFRPLEGRTMLVVGLGNIGEHVAALGQALGMNVLGVRHSGRTHPAVSEVHGLAALPELLPRADVVTVHIRASEQTRHLFDAAAFSAMRPGALFMNTSRGLVVDEVALTQSLRSGHLAGAYLDVFEVEPLPAESPLWGMEQVIITPHDADQVIDYPERFAGLFADNLRRWRAGEALINQV